MPPPDPRQATRARSRGARGKAAPAAEAAGRDRAARVDEENARPKKRYISPPRAKRSTRSTTTACAARSRTAAPRNFPEAAGKKLYGELTMMVTVNHDGRMLDTDVVERLRQPHARPARPAIAQVRRPLRHVQRAMRSASADQIVLCRLALQVHLRDETLETSSTSQA